MLQRARLLRAGALALIASLASCAADNGPTDGGPRRDGQATDGRSDAQGDAADRCAAGVDSDRDGLTNDQECALGSDPFVADSDMDGLNDGAEARYPRVCVADDHAAQRRPAPACTADGECMAGEHCRGLNPAASDSDGDGVPDGQEDPNLDGAISTADGETDPRLWDTDGDGMNDAMGGLEICRPAGLGTVTQVDIPGSPVQVGHDPAWGAARPVTGTSARNGLVLDDAASNVSAAVFSFASVGADVAAEADRVESAIVTALGAGVTGVLLGRALTTHETNPAIQSTYRVAARTAASTLRDALVMPLTGAAAPAGGATVGAGSEFLVDVTTVRRATGPAANHTDVIVTVSLRTDYETPTRPTSIRVNDLTNATGVAEAGKTLSHDCQVFTAGPAAVVDFLWTVDVSISMGPHQQAVGNTAARFFSDLNAAGVDFRVAVLQAQSAAFNFATPGVSWVPGTAAMGANQMAYQVTVEPYNMMAADTLHPYGNDGTFAQNVDEEPIAAAILAYEQLSTGAMMGLPVGQRLRPGAQVVAFFVADETGNNDENRYFTPGAARWGTGYATHLTRAIEFFHTNHIQTFGMVNTWPQTAPTTMCDPAAPQDMRRCVILGNGGAYIPINTATDADVAAAMARIVAAVAGSSSQYALRRSPITSTIRVRVRGVDVPRSRADGFDYDPASRSIVFFGTTHRPAMGDQVVISYRVWEGSIG